jgi:hypothetical protein
MTYRYEFEHIDGEPDSDGTVYDTPRDAALAALTFATTAYGVPTLVQQKRVLERNTPHNWTCDIPGEGTCRVIPVR